MSRDNATVYENPIAVDIKGLMGMLSCGYKSANKVGENAGAVVRVGRRKLYNVEKIKAYLDRGE